LRRYEVRPSAIARAEVLEDYRLRLTFDDGVVGEVDLESRIVRRGGVFRALEDPVFFRRVEVHPDLGTIVWPNDVDFCPDVLRHWATGAPLPEDPPFDSATTLADPGSSDP
jgi:hypothetical protein